MGYVKVGGNLGCNVHEMMDRSRAIRRIATLVFRIANFDLFKDLLGGIP